MGQNSERHFQAGDKVVRNVVGTVLSGPDDDGEYSVKWVYGPGHEHEGALDDEAYYPAEDLISMQEESEFPLIPKDYVRHKKQDNVGQVIAIAKGRAWVDWAPFDPDEDAISAISVSLLVRATPEEVADARGDKK